MKISYIFNVCCYGGLETAIKNRMDYLKDIGIESQAICLNKGFEDDLFRNHTHFTIKSYEQLMDITKNSDVVTALSSSVYDRLRRLDKTIVAESHYGDFDILKKKLQGKGIKAVIFPTRARLEEGAQYIPNGIPSYVVPNCIGKDFIQKVQMPLYNSNNNIKTVLWIGHLNDGKNWMMLPGLAERLPDNYRIKVIASIYQRQDHKKLLERIQGKPYSNKIELVINCPYSEIANYYIEAAASGCYLSTSYYESFGMTVLEAMSAMCPMVLSDLAAFKEVIGDGALYFKPDDIDTCLNNIINICENSIVRTNMLSKMQDTYSTNFDSIKICKDYVNIIKSVINEK